MPRASSRSSARPVRSSSCARSSSSASSGSAPARARAAQQQRQRDQPRLRPVVQVALQPAALGVAGLDEPRARRPQLLQPHAQLGVELRDVAAQQAAEERERQHGGGQERGQPGGVAGAGPRDHHEQEREQRGRVHRRQLEPLVRARAAPVHDRPHEHDQEQHDVERRGERERDVRQVLVAPDEQQIDRALVAAQVVRAGEEHRGQERERDDHVARDHDRAVRPRRQPPRREAHAEVEEHAAPEPAEQDPDRVDQPRVRRPERGEEPREPEQHHQQADPALGPPPPGVQAGADEAPADPGPEDRPQRLRVLVGARQHEHDDAGSARDRGEHDRAQEAGGQARKAMVAASWHGLAPRPTGEQMRRHASSATVSSPAAPSDVTARTWFHAVQSRT
jgi:hypothetical protein